jgi:ferredoxin-NADP reductase
MLKFALAHHPELRHTFIYSNKTWRDVIFREALDELADRHPDRLNVIHTLTREQDPALFTTKVRKGRVDLALLRETIPNPTDCIVYVCGPAISKWDVAAAEQAGTRPEPRFLETALDALKTLGVPQARIKRESYG